jgi:hypothetical protein
MPKSHRKKSHRAKARHHTAHQRPRRKKRVAAGSPAATKSHHHKRRHSHTSGLPGELRKKFERPVTVKTLKDIVALRRVQRGA